MPNPVNIQAELRLLSATAQTDDYVNRELGTDGARALSDAADRLRQLMIQLTPDFGEELSPERRRLARDLRWVAEGLLDVGHAVYPHVIDDEATRKARRDAARGIPMRLRRPGGEDA